MNPVIEHWFLTCLLSCGPIEPDELPWQYLDRISYWFKVTIPNGSGHGWYAGWFVKWQGELYGDQT